MTNKDRMIKGSLFLLLILSISLSGFTQNGGDCNCTHNFKELQKSIEDSYVGFNNKVSKNKIDRYRSLLDSIDKVAKMAGDYDCYLLLKKYVAFFNDPHMNIWMMPDNDTSLKYRVQAMFKGTGKLKYNEDSLRMYFDSNKIADVEGIWKLDGQNVTIAIFKNHAKNRDFVGIMLNQDDVFWSPGEIKAEIKEKAGTYSIKYYKRDHLAEYPTVEIKNGQMILSKIGTFRRVHPIMKGDGPITIGSKPEFGKLSDSCVLLTIPSFGISHRADIDSLIEKNSAIIEKTKFLVIDIRNNSGGHIMSTGSLMPLIYTDTIRDDGFVVKSSKENIEIYKEQLKNEDFSEEDKQTFQGIIDKLEKNRGSLVQIYEGSEIVFSDVKAFPKKIAILANEGTMSTAELFLLRAKQSSKVILFGSNTRGALDYADIGRVRMLSCPYLVYTCPMGMADHTRSPYIDNIGIVPNVSIGKDAGNWIEFVKEYLNNMKY